MAVKSGRLYAHARVDLAAVERDVIQCLHESVRKHTTIEIEHPAEAARAEWQALPWYKRLWYWLVSA